MKRTFIPTAGTSAVLALCLLGSASGTLAHETYRSVDVETATCPCASQAATLQQRLERLQRRLPLGQTAASYPDHLRDRGWKVTNSRIEYDIEKGDLTAKLRLEFDEETGRVTQISVVDNVEPARETDDNFTHHEPRRMHFAEARQPQPWQEREPTDQSATYGSPYSDRDRVRAERMTAMRYGSLAPGFRYSDRARVQLGQMLAQLRSLPAGRNKRFYYSALRRQGYDIPAIYVDTPEQLQLEVEKNDQRAVVTITFADEPDTSAEVYASPLPSAEGLTRTSSALP